MGFPWRSFREWLADEEKLGDVVKVGVPIKCGDPESIVDAVPADLKAEQQRVINCAGANGKMMESEMRALLRYLHTFPNSPVGLIEKPVNNRPDVPVVINPFATRERSLRVCGVESKDELCGKIGKMKHTLVAPKAVVLAYAVLSVES